jgi:cobalamin biosynthesis Mg chelatase CobN
MTEQQKAAQAYVEQMGLSKIASFKPSAQSDAPASSGSTTMTRGDGASSGVTGRDVTVSKPVYSPDADVQTQFATSAGSGISAVHVAVGLAALVALGIGIYAFTQD